MDICDAICCKVRKEALSGIEEKTKEHHAKIRKFGGEILSSNRHNTIKISTARLLEGRCQQI